MAYGDYVNSTVQKYGGDLARPTKFSMFLNLPTFLSNLENGTKLDVLCKNVTLPSLRNEPIELKYKGHTLKIKGRANYNQTIAVTFYLDEKYEIYNMFSNWIRKTDNEIISGEKNEEGVYGLAKILVKSFSESANTAEFTFYDLFPISIGELEYNTSSTSSINEFTVEFAYSYFKTGENTRDFNNIFEDAKNKIIDKALDKVGGIFGLDGKDLRKSVPAAVDIFKKL